jgi:hypothetical protein
MIQWVGYFALLNAVVTIALARRGQNIDNGVRGFLLRYAGNLAVLGAIELFFDDSLRFLDVVFFTLLFTVLVTTYNRYRVAYDVRFGRHGDVKSMSAG